MPFLARAKGRAVRLRDFGREGRPMIHVGSEPVVLLDVHPRSKMIPGGDKDVELVPLKSADGYELPEPVGVKLVAKSSEPELNEATGQSEPSSEPEQHKRRSRR